MLKSYIFTLVIIATLSGCTSYIPPDKPANQLAYIKESSPTKYEYIEIKKVNGVPTHSLKDFWTNGVGTETIPVESGKCTLTLNYSRLDGEADGEFTLNAEAGKTYTLHRKMEKTGKWIKFLGVVFYAIDESTGEIVGDFPADLKAAIKESHQNS